MTSEMLFRSSEVLRLCEEYAQEPDFAVPEIVRLARSTALTEERQEIEQAFQALPVTVRKELRSRFVSTDHAQHKSAWFQIRLNPWFNKFSRVTSEPQLLGNHPDFLLDINGQQIVVEARAVLIPEAVRISEAREQEVLWILNQIEAPSFAVRLRTVDLQSRIEPAHFLKRVEIWLRNSPEAILVYSDEHDNRIVLQALWKRERGGVATVGPTRSSWIDSNQFQRPLREKASQHRAIRRSEHPYLIAVYLEDMSFSAEEIVEAWFGKQTAIIDINTLEVVDQQIDRSGIHYYGQEIRHRSVTGTLVFRDSFDESQQGRPLQAWYIQNPYASKPIDPAILPVMARFVVQNQDKRNYQMGWEPGAVLEVVT